MYIEFISSTHFKFSKTNEKKESKINMLINVLKSVLYRFCFGPGDGDAECAGKEGVIK